MAVKIGLKYIDIWKESMEDEVLEYEKEPIEKGKIVFYGPSNFTRWSARFGNRPLSESILGKSGEKCAINRGFGSSCAEHHLYYYSRMVKPLEPKVLVYTPISNFAPFGYSVEEAWELGQRVIAWAETDFPGIQIYTSGHNVHKPADNLCKVEEIKRINATIKAFCDLKENRHFFSPYNNPELANRKDIYVEDGEHFNQEGYDIYTEFFKEILKDELAKY